MLDRAAFCSDVRCVTSLRRHEVLKIVATGRVGFTILLQEQAHQSQAGHMSSVESAKAIAFGFHAFNLWQEVADAAYHLPFDVRH